MTFILQLLSCVVIQERGSQHLLCPAVTPRQALVLLDGVLCVYTLISQLMPRLPWLSSLAGKESLIPNRWSDTQEPCPLEGYPPPAHNHGSIPGDPYLSLAPGLSSSPTQKRPSVWFRQLQGRESLPGFRQEASRSGRSHPDHPHAGWVTLWAEGVTPPSPRLSWLDGGMVCPCFALSESSCCSPPALSPLPPLAHPPPLLRIDAGAPARPTSLAATWPRWSCTRRWVMRRRRRRARYEKNKTN